MGKMKLDNSKNNGMLVGEALHMQNLCEICMYSSCTECPSRRSSADEDWHDFPQVIEGVNTAGGVKVTKCEHFTERPSTSSRKKTESGSLEWDRATKRHVKVLKRNK